MTFPTPVESRCAVRSLRGAVCAIPGQRMASMAASGVALAILVAACGAGAASAPADSPDAPDADEAEVRSYPPNEISRAEIMERGANSHNAMQLIRRLRPRWLFRNPVVYFDNISRPGGARALFDIPLGVIRMMEFIGPADATTRWGTGHMGGAIRVVSGR